MSKIYRAVLVGTGSICEAHLRAVESTEGQVELVAAVDLDQDRVDAFCKRANVPAAYTDYTKMLQEVGPDIVLVATPPSQHAAMSIEAMEAGAWVLCEKPLCGSLAELDRIREAEQRTGCYTACVFQMRFASSNLHLKRLIDAGQLGRPLVGVCNTLWYRDAAYYAVPWRGRWETELGGPTMGLGIHAMDHFLDLFGEWEEVRAMAGTLDRDIEVEDVSMAMVRFSNGAFGSIVNSALSPRQETNLRLDFQRATVELTHLYGYTRDSWKVTLAPPAQDDSLLQAWQSYPPDVGSTHGAQLTAFVKNMERGECPHTSGIEARRTIELLTAIYKSAFTNRPVLRGSIEPGDPYYTQLHGGGKPYSASPNT
ncbi:Gfo/Idh/MocA family protein [Synoicihabitans lomoniglobus]|uniref:Gfo/Idh/MocA family oxidoreductase n=1 Tax=Synoicihabitans lomoniglobus TaxID=2909285 RepID=A0AAF0CS38_9BACT|nr:Gfo/Idh/MocA family oxidoreductase [Opitutaceae bacterium LMO-M01]WED66966.1 Gfo/Idh/MocA family oxidoreductase [Opitutaceae bacterium LMO-M01]